MQRIYPHGARKRPIAGRYFCMIAMLCSSMALAQPWTLAQGREHVLATPHLQELEKAAVLLEHARGRAALPWSNPFIGFQREQSLGASAIGPGGQAGISGNSENYLWIGQKFDFSFRRGLFEEAGKRRGAAAALLSQARRRDLVLAFESLFFQAVAAAHDHEARGRWIERLAELVRLARAREEAGDASRYDVLRLERETIQAKRQRDRAEIAHAEVLGALAAWLDDDAAQIQIQGRLRPDAPPPLNKPPRPLQALALEEEARALTLENDAARRWFLPPVTATAGGKTVFGHRGLSPQTGELGYLFTLQVPLPVFERAGAKMDKLSAARRVALAEAEMEAHHVKKKAAAARAAWARALAALTAHETRSQDGEASLVKTARAAFAGGELSLLGLLEAERTVLEDELTTIDLSLTARHAQLVFAAATLESTP